MHELSILLDYCDEQYTQSNPCNCGPFCTNSNFCQGVQHDCYACIRRVHSLGNRIVHYNCQNMLYYYVLKHSYRFAMEVFLLFKARQKSFAEYDDIWITSIGCGPCTELFGAIAFWRGLNKDEKAFHFHGFDLQQEWTPIMNKILGLFEGINVQPKNEDCFEYYKSHEERVDVILLNYMLSDMAKFHGAQFKAFLFRLCAFIQEKHPRYIMINDIYLRDSLAASNALLNYIKEAGFSFQFGRRQFHPLKENIGKYGTLFEPKSFKIPNERIKEVYNPFSEVKSIQTIITFQ